MLPSLPPAIHKLIRELSKLPSVGEKTATRLAYHLVNNDRPLAQSLAEALVKASQDVKLCIDCFHMTDKERCTVCLSPARERETICVVEKPMDLLVIERCGEYRGLYHVLHGLWAPLRGQGPESMKLQELIERVKRDQVKEVILATGATVEGDATALYIARILLELGVKTTRPAQGIPKGGELEYADDITLSRAFMGRNVINL